MLYEPTLFSLIDAASPKPNAADGIRQTVALAAASLARGDRSAAAEVFIDYWMGEGTWLSKPEPHRQAIEAAVVNVQRWGDALFGETTPLAAFRALKMPVLLMLGNDTTSSARAVATMLAQTLPQAETLILPGLGHMGPVTHPEQVDDAIDGFLRRIPAL